MGLKKNDLFSITLDYFKSYLPYMRKCSPATIRTYQIAMEQYLDYLKEQNGVMLYKVTISMMDRKSMIETTLIYAYADTEQKRKAIEKAIPEDSTLKAFLNSERYRLDDDDLIKRLYGLK